MLVVDVVGRGVHRRESSIEFAVEGREAVHCSAVQCRVGQISTFPVVSKPTVGHLVDNYRCCTETVLVRQPGDGHFVTALKH